MKARLQVQEHTPAIAAPQDREAWWRLARVLAEVLRLRERRNVSDPRTVH